jgi:hypothetical protein
LSFGVPDHTESIEFEMSDVAMLRFLAYLQELGPYSSQTLPTSPSAPVDPRVRRFSLIDGGKK